MKIHDAVEVAKTSLGLVFGSAFQIPMVCSPDYMSCSLERLIAVMVNIDLDYASNNVPPLHLPPIHAEAERGSL